MIAFPFRRTRRGGSTWRPAAPAIEQFVEWSSPKSSEFLASPGGKLPGLTALRNRQDWLMRGGDRLVNECSWMSSLCSRLLQSSSCCGVFKRSPPLISHDKISVPRCRYFIVTASPRGKPRGQLRELVPFNVPLSSICQRVAKLATPTNSKAFGDFRSTNHSIAWISGG